ncbi:MAG: Zn-ribbon domain-containing OB-fold protein [Dehalococcoidia bacterium]|nr:Zn-ribbon domain-containing OB-fold protein [Dehalococcoidia bacterium]
MASEYNKPLPVITEENQPYWDACKRHELRIQRCRNCGRYRHYPRPMCPHCHSLEVEWAKVSGKGKIYNYMISHIAAHPGFAKEVPYGTVTIELCEGVRMVSCMVDVKPEELEIGIPVEVVFADITDDVTLPMFVRSRDTYSAGS